MSNLSVIEREPIYIPIKIGEHLEKNEKTGRSRMVSDKVDYELIYSMEAFMTLEKEYGSVDAAMDALSDNSVANVTRLLHAGFEHMNNPPSLSAVAKSVNIQNVTEISEIIKNALQADTGDSLDGENPNA